MLKYDLSTFVDEKREDFLIKYADVTFVGEIKGITSNVKSENISQLDVHCQSYADQLESEGKDENIKGLLIINPLRSKPLSERDEVHEKQIELAKRNGSLIITSDILLFLFEKYLKAEIASTKGHNTMELKSNFNPLTATAAHENTILAAPVLPKDMPAPFDHAWGYLDKPGEMERHRHPKEEVYFFFKGEGLVFVDGAEIPVQPGDVVRIPVNALHTVINRRNEELLWAALWWTEAK